MTGYKLWRSELCNLHIHVPAGLAGIGDMIWVEFAVGSHPCTEGFSPGSFRQSRTPRPALLFRILINLTAISSIFPIACEAGEAVFAH